jgi:hypothetical protein
LNRISAADKHKSQVNPLQHDEFQQVPSAFCGTYSANLTRYVAQVTCIIELGSRRLWVSNPSAPTIRINYLALLA